MFAAVKDGIIVALVDGVIDPMETKKICAPLEKMTEEWIAVQEGRQNVAEKNKAVRDIVKQGRKVKRSPVMKRIPRAQKKLLASYEKPYYEARAKLEEAKRELAAVGRAYKLKRRQIYKENAVRLAPGGCIPATKDILSKWRNLKEGQVLTAEGEVKDGS